MDTSYAPGSEDAFVNERKRTSVLMELKVHRGAIIHQGQVTKRGTSPRGQEDESIELFLGIAGTEAWWQGGEDMDSTGGWTERALCF